MSKDKRALLVMERTGSGYMVSLTEVRLRYSAREQPAYLLAVGALPPWIEGDRIRCVTCLAPIGDDGHACSVRRTAELSEGRLQGAHQDDR